MRLLICDPDPVFRKRLRDVLIGSTFDPVESVAGWTALHAALKTGTSTDMVVAAWPAGTVGAALDGLRAQAPHAKLVLLSDGQNYSTLRAALAAGADGVVSKTMAAPAFLHALLLVMLGETVFPPPPAQGRAGEASGSEAAAENGQLAALSARECQILSRLASGQPNKAIARDLSIAEATVKIHVKNVLRKIGAQNRTQAALWALSHSGKADVGATWSVA